MILSQTAKGTRSAEYEYSDNATELEGSNTHDSSESDSCKGEYGDNPLSQLSFLRQYVAEKKFGVNVNNWNCRKIVCASLPVAVMEVPVLFRAMIKHVISHSLLNAKRTGT